MQLEQPSGRGTWDSHKAGTTTTENANDDGLDGGTELVDDLVRAERKRLSLGAKWLSTLGTIAAAGVFVLLAEAATLERRLLWFAAMTTVALAMYVGASVPRLRDRVDPWGMPELLSYAHMASGTTWAAVLWIDPAATAEAQYRTTALALLFAVSAGAASGVAGMNSLGFRVMTPMWVLSSISFFANGYVIPGVAGLTFLALMVHDQLSNGDTLRELISLRVESQQRAAANAWAARHDGLTSLVNRSGVIEAMSETGPDFDVTAMFIDLDHFKEVNDRFGHAAGDQVLIEVAERLRICFRPTDLVARIGGDEFVVVLDRELEDATVDALARRVISALEEPIELPGGEEAYISASVGVTTLDPAEAEPQRLLHEADHALYEAKRLGRRRVVRFSESLEERLRHQTGLETSLRKAVRSDALECAAQPIFDLRDGRIEAVELLARWPRENGEPVSPGIFIPLAEETGLIDDLTHSMLSRAGHLLSRWRAIPALADVQVGLNVSPVQLTRPALIDSVREVVRTHGLRPGQLVLELTETTQLADRKEVAESFQTLWDLGVRIVIDDFGTGYSSLAALLSLDVSAVKLDRSLIAELGSDPKQHAVVTAIHQLAETVGRVVVAEGIETAQQIGQLQHIGVPLGQGFGLCRPLPIDQVEQRLLTFDWKDTLAQLTNATEPVSIAG